MQQRTRSRLAPAFALGLAAVLAACGTTVRIPAGAIGSTRASGAGEDSITAAAQADPGAPDSLIATPSGPTPTTIPRASAAGNVALDTGGDSGTPAPRLGPGGLPSIGRRPGSRPSAKITGSAAPAKNPPTGSRTATTPAAVSTGSSLVPLQIGLTYQNNGAAVAALGATTPGLTAQSAAEAMVTGINAAGGLNGRRLQAVEYGFNDTDNDFSEDATAACDKFTQDNNVALVLDTGFGTDAGFRDCLRKAGVVDITSGDEGDEAAASQDPLHVNASQSNHDRAYSSVLRGLVANGFVTRSRQLGVIVESCAEDTGPYQQTLVPLIAKLGIKSPVKQTVNCTTGFSSAAADASSINSAILAFRGAGVDRVLFVSGYESLLFLLFAESANSQNYTPGYLLSSTSAPEQIRGQVPQSQWPGMHGVGNFPAIDVDGATPTAVDSRCVKIAAAADVVPSGYGDYAVLYPACSPFLLLEAALRKTNNDTSPQTLMGAINSLGKTFAAPGVLGNSTEITATVHDAPNLGQVFSFDAACTCMHYTGTPMVA